MNESIPIVIAGASGLAKEIYGVLKAVYKAQLNKHFLGFIDIKNTGHTVIDSYKIIGSDDFALRELGRIQVVIAQGFPKMRKKIYDFYKGNEQIHFPNIIHPSVQADFENIKLGEGNIIMANCVLSPGVEMGNGNLLNTGSMVAHDVKMGSFNVMNPGANISGNVTIADECLFGASCVVHQGVTVSAQTIVGIGAVLTRNTKEETTYFGNPAKKIS